MVKFSFYWRSQIVSFTTQNTNFAQLQKAIIILKSCIKKSVLNIIVGLIYLFNFRDFNSQYYKHKNKCLCIYFNFPLIFVTFFFVVLKCEGGQVSAKINHPVFSTGESLAMTYNSSLQGQLLQSICYKFIVVKSHLLLRRKQLRIY